MTLIDPNKIPRHVAVIIDCNGRWAKKRGINRFLGHEKGTEAVREIVRTSREIGIQWLTLYAFSEENLKRSKLEIQALMKLLKRFLKGELKEMQENGIRLQTIGRTQKLPDDTRKILLETIKKTASNSIDAAHSISRNISEGYCRRSLKEYLNYLNIALGSAGEFHSCYLSCKQAHQITAEEYEQLDQLHYKVENSLLRLVESLQKKQKEKQWEDNFQSK